MTILNKENKTNKSTINSKEKEIIDLKVSMLQYEEQSLQSQQELIVYKKETEAKIVQLQSRYNEEISKVHKEKQLAIDELTNRIQQAQNKRNLSINDQIIGNFNGKAETPQQEGSRSFTVLRQDTGSTSSKFVRHQRQHSDSRTRNFSMQNLKQILANTIQPTSKVMNASGKQLNKKSHRKSTHSLNFSKLSERNISKSKN